MRRPDPDQEGLRGRAVPTAAAVAVVLIGAFSIAVLASARNGSGVLDSSATWLAIAMTAALMMISLWAVESRVLISRREAKERAAVRIQARRKRTAELRAMVSEALSSTSDDLDEGLSALVDLVVPALCDRCVVEIVKAKGELRIAALRDVHRDARDVLSGGAKRAPSEAAMAERAFAAASTQVDPDGRAKSTTVVAPLRTGGHVYGTITFSLGAARGRFEQDDVDLAEEIAASTATFIERTALRQSTRDAVRRSQRIARQLHQLIAASINAASMRMEQDLLVALAGRARSVFDGDLAVVTLDAGPAAPLRIESARGVESVSRELDAGVDDDARPPVALGPIPVVAGAWLVASLRARGGEPRGSVAIRRSAGPSFGADDLEVIALLAHMASTTLEAAELNRAVDASEARWRVLVETAPVGIVETDVAGRVLWWNHAAAALFEWPDHDGGTDAPTIPAGIAEPLQELWASVRLGESTRSIDISDVEIAGRPGEFTASAARLAPAGEDAGGILTLVDDVTEHRRLMAELRHAQRMEVIGQLSSSVAHDFNNLLTLIAGYAELLALELKDQDRPSQLVQDIQVTATRAAVLTGKLLTMGRTSVPAPVVIAPVTAMRSIAEVLERVVGADIELVMSYDDAAGNVRVDADQFQQMVLNLAFNARDAMSAGGVLTIRVERAELDEARARAVGLAAAPHVRIVVSDTGAGMDEETRRRCFEPLFTTKGPLKGTGLGLPAVRRVVEESGGAITCTTALGRGTTFEVLLPAIDEEARAAGPEAPEARPKATATVLLAEDNEGIRTLVGRVLTTSGYRVLSAESGEQAIELALAHDGTIDLLLTDVVMPGMSGQELAAALQAEHGSLRVLLVSGNVEATVVEGLREGSAAFLAKPFKPSELIDRVSELLERPGAVGGAASAQVASAAAGSPAEFGSNR